MGRNDRRSDLARGQAARLVSAALSPDKSSAIAAERGIVLTVSGDKLRILDGTSDPRRFWLHVNGPLVAELSGSDCRALASALLAAAARADEENEP